MKCPSCGAETKGNVCEYCGSQLPSQQTMCSKCGSKNVSFKRENVGEIRSKKSKQVVHRTVGFCKDCGNTWYVSSDEPKKSKTWLWVLGWICVFPVPLTILMLRNKTLKPAVKYAIIAVGWIVYLLIAFGGKSTETSASSPKENSSPASIETVAQADDTEQPETPLSFVLTNGETGEFGVEVVLNEGTEFEEHEIAYYVPAGIYLVENLNDKGTEQVNVYCGGPEKNGEWDEFVIDDNCAKPIVVTAGESKDLEIKEGQFVVLSDETGNLLFTIK